MRHFKRWAAWMLSLTLLSAAAPATVRAASDKDQAAEIKRQLSARKETGYAEGEALVMYRTTVSGQKNRTVPFSSGIKVKKAWNFPTDLKGRKRAKPQDSVVSIARVTSGKSTDELIRQLKKDPQVIAAQPNYKIKLLGGSDPYFDFQWANKNQGQNGGSAGKDTGYEQFYSRTSAAKGKDTVVAVVDTGIDLEHEDLKSRLWTNKSDVISGEHGYDFVNNDTDPSDDYGHGTHCAGIIAAQAGNGKGTAGISQSSDIKLMALKVFDEDGGGEVSSVIDAYYYIYKQQMEGVNVAAVNNSWGSDEAEEQELMKYLIDLVGKKGAVTVCAAGNESEDNDRTPVIPAGIDSEYLISVAASNEKDALATYSNYGKDSVHMAAPGNHILSTVPDDCFNPSIYSEDERKSNCEFFKDYNDGNVSEIKTDDAGSAGKGSVTVSADNDYFGKESAGKSAKISVKNAKAGNIYTVYLPYDSTKGSTESYMSTMLKAVSSKTVEDGAGLVMVKDYKLDDDGQIADPLTLEEAAVNMLSGTLPMVGVNGEMNEWEHLFYPSRSITKNEKRAVGISLIALADQDFTVFLDDTAVSKAGVSSESFGKYDFYSGTSMAAPFVSGAVANSSLYYGKKDAIANRAAVLGMTRTADLPVTTRGVLDGRKLSDQNPILTRASVSGGRVILSGKGFEGGGGSVKVNGRTEKTASWSDAKIVLENRQLVNRVANVEIRTKSGKTVTGEFYFVKGKNGPKEVFSTEDISNGGDVVSDGRQLYYMDRDLNLYVMDEEEEEFTRISSMEREKVFAGVKKGELDRADMDLDSVPVYCDKAVYVIAEADLGYETKRSLVCYSFKTKKWSRIDSYLPKTGGARLEGSALAAYNGKIYVIGGRNKKTGVMDKSVFCYDTEKKQWKKAAGLPEGRYKSAAVQSGNQLILTLGSGGRKGEIPKNLVYSDKNKKWVKKTASLIPKNKNEEIYKASVGVCKDGLAYVGLDTDGYGNVFRYSASKDRFEAMDYQTAFDEDMTGTAVGSRFLLMPVTVQDDFDFNNFSRKKPSARPKAQSDDEDDEDYDNSSTVYSYPVASGLVKVSAKTKHGTIAGKGGYLPGQKVTVKPKAAKYYCYKPSTMKAAGKKIKGSSYSFRITGNVSVAAVFKKTVVKLNKKNLSLSAGRTYRLKAKVKTVGKKKSVTWKTGNSKYASVSKKGVVKAKKAGRGKTVTIYARAKDGSRSYAKLKVKIR